MIKPLDATVDTYYAENYNGDMAKLYWNGDVGYISNDGSGITIDTVKAALDSANGQPIEVELTTMGGDFFQAAPILNMLRNYQGQKTVYLNGIVASAGTVIAIGFDTIIARPTSMFMIHNAQSIAFGDHNAMRDAANLYERMSNTIAEEYAATTGKTVADMKALMDAETWMMGQEIVDAGFADKMENDASMKASAMMLVTAQKQFRDRVTMWAKMPVTMADQSIKSSMAHCESLINSGTFDNTSPWIFTAADENKMLGTNGDDWANYKSWHAVQDTALPADTKARYKYPFGKDGKVYRSALRSIASRAASNNLQEVSDWASSMIKLMDEKKGAMKVNKEAVLAWLKDNPGCASEVAATMGLNLVTESVTKAVEMKAKLDAEKIADPLALIATMKADLEKVESDRVTNKLAAEFGPEKLDNGVVNNLRSYANAMLKGVKFAELSARLEEFKKDPIALKLAGERMDVNSDQNLIGVSEGLNKQEKKVDMMLAGVKVTVV